MSGKMQAVGIVLTVVVGLVCSVLTEIVAVTWMNSAPASLDLIGNFYLFVVTPAVVLVSVLGGLTLTRFLRQPSVAPAILFPLVFAGAQFLLLTNFSNPLENRLTYLAITLVVTVLVVLWRRSGRTVGPVAVGSEAG